MIQFRVELDSYDPNRWVIRQWDGAQWVRRADGRNRVKLRVMLAWCCWLELLREPGP